MNTGERHRPGVRFSDTGTAELSLWAPEAQQVWLYIRHQDGCIPLCARELGYWTLQTDRLRPGDYYWLVLDDDRLLPDPASLAQPEGVHGPSMALDLSFPWTDAGWQPPPLSEWIFYELHTGTFTPQGTFAAVESRLDHLLELGITAIELMPVAQFPGTRNWGYDGVFPYAVQHSYGGARGLQHLVDACHARGLAVVLDVVYNHLGPEGNYLGAFGPYFTDKYRTPWGRAVNYDDACCDGVRHYVTENALMWFRDFHIDALRLDAVHAIRDFGAEHILHHIRRHTDELMQHTGRTHRLIVECDLNDPRYIDPPAARGYGMDAQWNDEFHHSLRVAAGNPRDGYYADFNGVRHLAKAYRDAYVYDGLYSPHRRRTFGAKAADNPGSQFVVFSQNHDQVGNRMLGERSSVLTSFEMQKLMAGAVLLSPFLPLLFMGEEWSETNPFLYFISHCDQQLVAAVRQGRREEFAAFHADGTPPDPQAASTFTGSKLQWPLLKQEPHATMFRCYKALIALRRNHPVLSRTDRHQIEAVADEATNVLSLHRWHQEQHIRCFLNFSKNPQEVSLPSGTPHWKKLFDSAEPLWNGPEAAPAFAESGARLILQPESLLVYGHEHF